MPSIFQPPSKHKRVIRKRRESGLDRYDEVWDGVYVMSPLANFEHQLLAFRLAHAFTLALPETMSQKIAPGAHISDQSEDWTKNYRVPDVVVFLPDNPARIFETHASGGPDFAVEVISKSNRPGEMKRKHKDYFRSNVRVVWFVDPRTRSRADRRSAKTWRSRPCRGECWEPPARAGRR